MRTVISEAVRVSSALAGRSVGIFMVSSNDGVDSRNNRISCFLCEEGRKRLLDSWTPCLQEAKESNSQ
jgi:hypothetical protein